ncbi:hypothetical protein TYRP_000068 [Tyrophagus putrescentiae]|nr:hypothetical protein TYRP_000068 [Tyrophagus putrescentiae]
MSSPTSLSPTPSSPPDSSAGQLLLNGKPIAILKNPNLMELGDGEPTSFESDDTSMDSSKGSLIVGETSTETDDVSCAISETSYHSEDEEFDVFKFNQIASEVYQLSSQLSYSSDAEDGTSAASSSVEEPCEADSSDAKSDAQSSAESNRFDDCPEK